MARSRQSGHALDRAIIVLLMLAALLVAARAWLADHPQHDPWAPLDLTDPPGWATKTKLAALRSDPAECRAVLARSGVAFEPLAPTGEGACARPDRIVLADAPLVPGSPATTCPVAAGVELWLQQSVEPAARAILGSPLARIEHLGTYSCRRVGGGESGRWSEHATGNAIDIAAFVLADGRRISVLADWGGADEEGGLDDEGGTDGGKGEAEEAFLRTVRGGACDIFGTVLSPDYNAAHVDHFHLDQAARGFGGVCR